MDLKLGFQRALRDCWLLATFQWRQFWREISDVRV
jgi:hypothetical protein